MQISKAIFTILAVSFSSVYAQTEELVTLTVVGNMLSTIDDTSAVSAAYVAAVNAVANNVASATTTYTGSCQDPIAIASEYSYECTAISESITKSEAQAQSSHLEANNADVVAALTNTLGADTVTVLTTDTAISTDAPTDSPTTSQYPTEVPTMSNYPTTAPSEPTSSPNNSPTASPTTGVPTLSPSLSPSAAPVVTANPTSQCEDTDIRIDFTWRRGTKNRKKCSWIAGKTSTQRAQICRSLAVPNKVPEGMDPEDLVPEKVSSFCPRTCGICPDQCKDHNRKFTVEQSAAEQQLLKPNGNPRTRKCSYLQKLGPASRIRFCKNKQVRTIPSLNRPNGRVYMFKHMCPYSCGLVGFGQCAPYLSNGLVNTNSVSV